MKKGVVRAKLSALIALAGFFLIVIPVGIFAEDPPPQEKGSLVGFVYGTQGKLPVVGAVVKIRSMGDGKEYVSEPTDAQGMYKISGIDAGWYFLGIVTPDGTEYNLSNGFYLKGYEIGRMSLSLRPGLTLEASGSAYAMRRGFFKTPGGIAVIVGGVALAGFGAYLLLKKESEPSPVIIY